MIAFFDRTVPSEMPPTLCRWWRWQMYPLKTHQAILSDYLVWTPRSLLAPPLQGKFSFPRIPFFINIFPLQPRKRCVLSVVPGFYLFFFFFFFLLFRAASCRMSIFTTGRSIYCRLPLSFFRRFSFFSVFFFLLPSHFTANLDRRQTVVFFPLVLPSTSDSTPRQGHCSFWCSVTLRNPSSPALLNFSSTVVKIRAP